MRGGWGGRAGGGFISIRELLAVSFLATTSFLILIVALMATVGDASETVWDWWVYLLAGFFGIGAGWADVVVNDLLFTALLVLASCMFLGILRPRWPWRWMIAVGVFVPLTEWAAYLLLTVKPSRAQVYGSFLAFFPGFAGAFGGSVVRRVAEICGRGNRFELWCVGAWFSGAAGKRAGVPAPHKLFHIIMEPYDYANISAHSAGSRCHCWPLG